MISAGIASLSTIWPAFGGNDFDLLSRSASACFTNARRIVSGKLNILNFTVLDKYSPLFGRTRVWFLDFATAMFLFFENVIGDCLTNDVAHQFTSGGGRHDVFDLDDRLDRILDLVVKPRRPRRSINISPQPIHLSRFNSSVIIRSDSLRNLVNDWDDDPKPGFDLSTDFSF